MLGWLHLGVIAISFIDLLGLADCFASEILLGIAILN